MLLKWSVCILFLGATFISFSRCDGYSDEQSLSGVPRKYSSRRLTKAEYKNERRVMMKYKGVVIKHAPETIKPFINCMMSIISSHDPNNKQALWTCCRYDFLNLIPYCRRKQPAPEVDPLPPMPPFPPKPTLEPRDPDEPSDPSDSTPADPPAQIIGGKTRAKYLDKFTTLPLIFKNNVEGKDEKIIKDDELTIENKGKRLDLRLSKQSQLIGVNGKAKKISKDEDLMDSSESVQVDEEQQPKGGSPNLRRKSSPRRVFDYRWARLFKRWQGEDPKPKSNRVSRW